jgi:putative membrane protein
MMMHGDGMMSMMLFMLLVGLVLIVLFVLLGIGIGKWLGRSQSPLSVTDGHNPTEILRTRYAKGEISRDEFDKIKRELEK